jgi:glutamate dehydrogenase/leucine dehydrogenase
MSTIIELPLRGEPAIQGYLAIDASVNGRSYGGVRIAPDLSGETLARVARAKTLKYGFLGLPVGGAKAGIAADPDMPAGRKREVLGKLGEALKPYLETRTFVPAEDVGTTAEDIRRMLQDSGLRVLPRSLVAGSGSFTSVTVVAAGLAAARRLGLDPRETSVAVEGFGSVGSAVALAFWRSGARVAAVSTSKGAIHHADGLDVGKLVALREQEGDRAVELFPGGQKIDKERLPELEVDIFSPCGQPDSITERNAGRVGARLVCPGANCPVTPEAEQVLLRRGIVSVPDFVSNCGGVLGMSMRRSGVKKHRIEGFLERTIPGEVVELLEAARREQVIPRTVAERVAAERFARAKAALEKRNIASRVFSLALELYRAGVIPCQLVAPFAPRYFAAKFR